MDEERRVKGRGKNRKWDEIFECGSVGLNRIKFTIEYDIMSKMNSNSTTSWIK